MKVVIPMAGRGSRFKEVGYKGPKPLIEVAGRPMIQWAVESVKNAVQVENADFIFVMLKEHESEFQIGQKMAELVPGSQALFIDEVTAGAAATVYLTNKLVDPEEELFITDSDQFFKMASFNKEREKALVSNYAGIIPTAEKNSPAYSYAEIDKNGYVLKTAEKELISTHAAIGVYYFTKSKFFMDSIQYMMDNKMLTKKEYYVCPVYNEVIKRGKVTIVNADFWMTMGTPAEKEAFEKYIQSQ